MWIVVIEKFEKQLLRQFEVNATKNCLITLKPGLHLRCKEVLCALVFSDVSVCLLTLKRQTHNSETEGQVKKHKKIVSVSILASCVSRLFISTSLVE